MFIFIYISGLFEDCNYYSLVETPSGRKFQCLCGNLYKCVDTVKRHIRYECGKEPQFVCIYCNKKSKRKSNLYQHIRLMHHDLV